MKKESLILLAVTFCLLIPMLTPMAKVAGQPPIDTSTLWKGKGAWSLLDADPGVAFAPADEELLFNTMQGLIAWNGELDWEYVPVLATNVPTLQQTTITVVSTSVVGLDPTGSRWIRGITSYICVGWVDELPSGFGTNDAMYLTDGIAWRTWTVDAISGTSTITLSLWRGWYVFNIRTNPTINFFDGTGAVVDMFDVDDVKYSMDWYEVTDLTGGPVQSANSYDEALFDDTSGHVYWSTPVAGGSPNPMDLAHLIDNAFEVNGNSFTINVGTHISDYDFKQILCNTWGCISSKTFNIAHGCWNGNLYDTAKYGGTSPPTIPPGGSTICPPNLPNCPDWYVDWADCPKISDPVNRPLSPLIYCGTGPYHVQVVDAVNLRVIMQRNPGFWMGWPAVLPNGVLANGSIDTVEIDYISVAATRTAMFTDGGLDVCASPTFGVVPWGIKDIKITTGTDFWCWYWVKGWYYNAKHPGTYYYTMWKADDCWYDISGSTPAVSDGVVNMKDLAYLIAHFNAKAPLWPGGPPPIDPKWVGVYGANGCVDPYSDRTCNVRDIAGVIFNFNAKGGTGHP